MVATATGSPFTEPTSPNPALTRHGETTPRLHSYGAYLLQSLPKFIQQFSVLRDELTLHVSPTGLVPVLTFLRDHSQCQFKACMDVSGADYPSRHKRFEVVYHLLSIRYAARIRVKTYAGEVDTVPSVTGVFRSADWCVMSSYSGRDFLTRSRSGLRGKCGICMVCSSRAILTCECLFTALSMVCCMIIISDDGFLPIMVRIPLSCRTCQSERYTIRIRGLPP